MNTFRIVLLLTGVFAISTPQSTEHVRVERVGSLPASSEDSFQHGLMTVSVENEPPEQTRVALNELIGNGQRGVVHEVDVPFWLFAAFFVGPLVLSTRASYQLHKRLKVGMCLRCGYDLRGSPGACPECGREPAEAPKAVE